MSKESSAEMAALAARLMGEPETATPTDVKRLAGSVLAQREPDPGNRVTLMHGALVKMRQVLLDKSRMVRRSDLLPVIAEGLGE